MNNRSDIDRVLQAWMADGPAAIPDRVVAVVATRIGVQRQRRAWPFQGRTNVTTPIKLIASLAAAIVVAVVGYSLLPGVAGPGAPTTAPTPSNPTATPIASAPPTLVDGVLAGGTYRLRPFLTTTMTIDATVPEGGWVGGLPGALAGPRGESNAPNGIAIAFLEAQSIHSDPCHWDQDGNGFAPDEGDVEVGPTVDDLAEALAASSAYESTQAVDVTLGGFTGKRLELQLVPDPSGCDTFEAGEDQFFVFGGRDAGQFAQGGANTWQVTIVDVEGTRLIAVLLSYAETSAEDLTAAQGILDSLVIRP
jgi:hypothetical protein